MELVWTETVNELGYERKLCAPTRANSAQEKDKFICSIILNEDNLCLDKKLARKARLREEWKNHKARLKKLAEPKKYYEIEDNANDSGGIPLERILPRLISLSKPKYFTPKYVKPPEEPYQLPGKIQDWEAHKKWLEIRAQPRRLPNPSLKSFRCPESKMSEDNLRRMLQLSKPKWRSFYKNPYCRAFNRFSLYDRVSERTFELSQPRKRVITNYGAKCRSESASSYEASDRVKSLAIPKYPKLKYERKKRRRCRSSSYENLLLKECKISQRVSLKTV